MNKLCKYNIFLTDASEFPYSEVTKALKLIFNMNSIEAGKAYTISHKEGDVLLECVHKEKKDLRTEQFNAWHEKSGFELPIKMVRVT